jgi:hypothetical protein
MDLVGRCGGAFERDMGSEFGQGKYKTEVNGQQHGGRFGPYVGCDTNDDGYMYGCMNNADFGKKKLVNDNILKDVFINCQKLGNLQGI